MGGTYNTTVGMRNAYKIVVGNLKNHLADLDVDVRTILKRMLENRVRKVKLSLCFN
jgi:hypothetical protein